MGTAEGGIGMSGLPQTGTAAAARAAWQPAEAQPAASRPAAGGERPFAAAWAEVDLARLVANFARVRQMVGPRVQVMPVLKEDAYGHGDVAVARALVRAGAARLVVSSVAEGIRLRHAGITAPILLSEYMFPDEADEVVAHRLTPTVHSLPVLRALAEAAARRETAVGVHLRVETLPGSMGTAPGELGAVLDELRRLAAVVPEGLYTHLTGAYVRDSERVRLQLERLREARAAAQKAGVKFSCVHAASSPSILTHPEAHLDAVRPGTVLYGLPSHPGQAPEGFEPVMQIKARVVHVHDGDGAPMGGYRAAAESEGAGRVATVPLGYGGARHLLRQEGGQVLIRGMRAPILGSARMAHVLVDVSALPGVRVGDEVVFVGRQGDEQITAEEAAARAGIPVVNCESLCLLATSVPRHYVGGEGEA